MSKIVMLKNGIKRDSRGNFDKSIEDSLGDFSIGEAYQLSDFEDEDIRVVFNSNKCYGIAIFVENDSIIDKPTYSVEVRMLETKNDLSSFLMSYRGSIYVSKELENDLYRGMEKFN